jgi:hypothetical protein
VGFTNNFKNFSRELTQGRLLNQAFKKEEIRRPSKVRHHDLKLVEKETIYQSGTYLAIQNDALDASFCVGVASSNRSLFRGPGEIVLEGDLDVYGTVRNDFMKGKEKYCNTALFWPVKIRPDRLPEYYEFSVRFFFDLIYSVTDPREILRGNGWNDHFHRVSERYKWRS